MIVFVACPIAAAICCVESKGLRIKYVNIGRKISSVQTHANATFYHTWINTVSIGQALSFTDFARMCWRASALTAVIFSIPQASSSRVIIQTVIIATDEHTLTVIVNVAIALAHSAHILVVFIAAIGASPAVHGDDGSFFNVEKYLLANSARGWILQITDVGHLTCSVHKTINEAYFFQSFTVQCASDEIVTVPYKRLRSVT
jgi:hypothetical protein